MFWKRSKVSRSWNLGRAAKAPKYKAVEGSRMLDCPFFGALGTGCHDTTLGCPFLGLSVLVVTHGRLGALFSGADGQGSRKHAWAPSPGALSARRSTPATCHTAHLVAPLRVLSTSDIGP
ncbi:hypothetical protein LR48_Vigan08g079900 [Vigna angularis]|uniref:Uncharacterized protein n=1 Tax=Phaseolus angularis TaxID=3914 RepID=A0A0L9V4U5_PHAAN|nr:hypothetical protein LR48_Vigan08g079900 [Vigna angularis]